MLSSFFRISLEFFYFSKKIFLDKIFLSTYSIRGKKWGKVGQFLGKYEHSLDEKGRLFMPAKFRKIDEKPIKLFILTIGLEDCLFVYPPHLWKTEVEDKIRQLSMTKKDMRDLCRALFAPAVECVVDKQGRITIPLEHRQHAGLHNCKEAVILGLSTRIEIWSKERWESYYAKHIKLHREEIAERVMP